MNARRILFFITKVQSWQPLTLRGAVLLILAFLTVRYIAIPNSDLVAAIIAGAVIVLTFFILIFALTHRLKTRKNLAAEVYFDSSNAKSCRDVAAGIVLEGSDVWPFFYLTVSRVFENRGTISPVHIIRGNEFKGVRRHIIDVVRFPHRGIWLMPALEVSLADIFGLTRFSWQIKQEAGVEVSPEITAIRPLPVVAASSRPGDELNFARERSGDPFDIKPYDPSDGISRILWKQYAKHGELVVRRPEQAVIPEGEVAVYLIANQFEDFVAGAAESYLAQLTAQDITVLFGTDALSGLPTADSKPRGSSSFTTDMEEILHSLNQNIWADFVGSGLGFGGYIDSLLEANYSIHQVIVLAPDRADWFQHVSSVLQKHGIKLVFGLVPQSLARTSPIKATNQQKTRAEFALVGSAVQQSGGEVIECEAASA